MEARVRNRWYSRIKKLSNVLDEIHKVKGWSSKIKFLYDNLPNLKFFLSGSASLMLEKEASSDLAGRYFLVEVSPLSLKEFAELHLKKHVDIHLQRDELERVFPLWIKRPFPEIVEWRDESRVYEYIRELVTERVVKVDLPGIYGVRGPLLSALSELFLSNPGMILNLSSLARDLRVGKQVLEEHLFFLEFAKIIRVVKNFRPSMRAESRKMKKIYPFHLALSFPYHPSLDRGKILEALVAQRMERYWREGSREVDFIGADLQPIEVKAKEEVRAGELGSLIYFMKKYGRKEGTVVYEGTSREERINSLKINFRNIVDFLLE